MIKNCINCGIPMVGVMSFSKDKHERFCRCPKCYSESRHRRVNDDELDFGEILYRIKWYNAIRFVGNSSDIVNVTVTRKISKD